VRRLGLSEGSVALRIQVANVARRFPQVLVAISENRISLTVAGRLAPRLCEKNVDKLLRDSAGMTRLEVEEYLVRLAPKPAFTASIRKKPSSASESERVRLEAGEAQARSERPSRPPLEETGREAPEDLPGLLQPARPDVYNFRFSAGKAFKEKLERLAEVLGIENPSGNMAHVLERALELALQRKDPKAKRERRLERERKQLAAGAKESCPDKNPAGEEALASRDGPAPSRYIPAAVRERALERAGYRCEYTGPGGTRCTSRTRLEIEHELPFAIFRSHDEHHLRVFCPGHNRLSAERVYGAEFVRARIEERRGCMYANATHPPRGASEDGPRRVLAAAVGLLTGTRTE
jgi:hypothetical protein